MGESRTVEPEAQLRDFESFVAVEGARLRRVLVAREGVDVGSDLCADALAAVWKEWDRVGRMENPAGYAYRVAQSANRRHRRWRRRLEFPREEFEPTWEDVSGDIFLSLGGLTPLQRTCVVLVHAHGWSYREVAEILDISVAAVTNHVHRGMRRLRRELGEAP